jgi:hypothetical protein
VEGKLGSLAFDFSIVHCFVALLVVALSLPTSVCAADVAGDVGGETARFRIVLFTCVYERAQLTEFVLEHYAGLATPLAAEDAVDLDIFITGSDAATTAPLAARFGAAYADFPNSPLGAKHNSGLAALRDHHTAADAPLPHAVVIVGSDDLLNRRFFTLTRDRMQDPSRAAPLLLLGLRDLYLYDLSAAATGGRLAYTKGYRRFADPLAATVGCGRVFAWPLLQFLDWTLWDGERERSLDQSTVRRVAEALAQVGGGVAAAAEAVMGAEDGVVAVDVKTGGLPGGRNIWSYDDIISAVGAKGKLHRFRSVGAAPFFDEHFGVGFEADALRPLLRRMLAASEHAAVADGSEETDGGLCDSGCGKLSASAAAGGPQAALASTCSLK